MTQEQLLRFTRKEARQILFSCSPLNIRHVLGTAVVSVLFPGIVLGYRRAIGITIALLACLLAAWLWESPVWSRRLLIFWAVWSGSVWVLWQLMLLITGISQWHKARAWQKAQPESDTAITSPWEHVLHWRAETDTRYSASIMLRAPRRGLYLLELNLHDDAAGDIINWEGTNACYCERETLPGVHDKHHAVFRLEAGCHDITLILDTDKLPVKSTLSQLNHI